MKTTRGFTLIELLVVIAIIGLLSSVVLGSLNQARAKARDARRSIDIHSMKTALARYHIDTGKYPLDDINFYRFSDNANELVPLYLPSIPLDPTHGESALGYRYGSNDTQTMYTILVDFEGDGVGWCEVDSPEGDPHWTNVDC